MLGTLRMKNAALILAMLGLGLGVAACGGDDKDGTTDGKDAGGDEPACGLDPRSTAKSAETGTIRGVVKLGDMAVPGGTYEAKGDLALAVLPTFDPSASCPGSKTAPKAVANTLIRCADFTGGKTVAYEIHGIPPRAEKYVIIPFLDVNGNSINDAESAGPDTCDLLGSVAPIAEATITMAGQEVTLDLELASNAEILGPICSLPACM